MSGMPVQFGACDYACMLIWRRPGRSTSGVYSLPKQPRIIVYDVASDSQLSRNHEASVARRWGCGKAFRIHAMDDATGAYGGVTRHKCPSVMNAWA